MLSVIVVPETTDFEHDVSHKNKVWISDKLGKPRLKSHNARYLAPFWVGGGNGVNRIYHIIKTTECESKVCTVIHLGNSFLVESCWDNMKQKKRFEYHKLKDFGFVEVCPGVIIPNI